MGTYERGVEIVPLDKKLPFYYSCILWDKDGVVMSLKERIRDIAEVLLYTQPDQMILEDTPKEIINKATEQIMKEVGKFTRCKHAWEPVANLEPDDTPTKYCKFCGIIKNI